MIENGGTGVADLEIIKGLERVNVKLDELLRRGDDHETRLRTLEQRPDLADDVTDHETRIRAVERWKWQIAGAVLAAGALGGGASQALSAVLGA